MLLSQSRCLRRNLTPPWRMRQGRNRVAVRALLDKGADVSAAQGDGMTALHWAAMSGDLELVQMLVHAGANLKAATRIGGGHTAPARG